MKITVYSKPSCQMCVATKRKLDKLGVAYAEGDLLDPANAELVATAKQVGVSAAPLVVVEYESGPADMWGGYRPDLLDELAAK